MQTFLQDLRYAARGLIRSRGFATIAIVTLALGIGANTAMFSVVNAVLLRELPYPDPSRLVMVWEHNMSSERAHNSVGPANFLAWRDVTKSFERMAAFAERRGSFTTGEGEPASLQARYATADIFPILGPSFVRGRGFSADEDRAGGPNVAVISYDLWQKQFGGRADIVGAPFRWNANAFTVVGVLPKDFKFYEPVDLWIPTQFGAEARTFPGRYMRVIARLKPGVTFAQANDEMVRVARQRAEDAPQLDANWTANVQPMRENLVGDVRTGLLVLLGAVGFLLVIACANVANLLLARATDREKEIAIRVSIGATPRRIVRQLLTESVLLAVVGSALGLALAELGTSAIVALIPRDFPAPTIADVTVDGRVLAFTLGVALITGLAFGVIPALAAARPALHDTLKEGGRSGTALTRASGRLRASLVVAEVSLAIVLLAGAGLMMRSFSELRGVQLGFDAEHVLRAQIVLPVRKYTSDTAWLAFFDQLEQKVATIPGVKSVGEISYLPLSGERSASDFTVSGRPKPEPGHEPTGDMRAVTPGYFRAMGIPIKAGRDLEPTDGVNTPDVAVISETMARTFWPGESAVGKYIDYNWGRDEHVLIVGVAGDVHHEGADKQPFNEIYRPLTQFPYNAMNLVVRGTGDAAQLAGPVREAVREMDRDLPVAQLSPMTRLVSESMGKSRLSTMLFGFFGLLGLVLAGVGTYGVIAYGVSQRKQEFGVRLALGAQPRDVLGLVMRQGMTLVLTGAVIGILGALVLTRLMSSLLFGVPPHDPLTFVAITGVLAVVALLASYLPARRATRTDPVVALRNE